VQRVFAHFHRAVISFNFNAARDFGTSPAAAARDRKRMRCNQLPWRRGRLRVLITHTDIFLPPT